MMQSLYINAPPKSRLGLPDIPSAFPRLQSILCVAPDLLLLPETPPPPTHPRDLPPTPASAKPPLPPLCIPPADFQREATGKQTCRFVPESSVWLHFGPDRRREESPVFMRLSSPLSIFGKNPRLVSTPLASTIPPSPVPRGTEGCRAVTLRGVNPPPTLPSGAPAAFAPRNQSRRDARGRRGPFAGPELRSASP